ncbi:MAG: hypothetical protein ACE5F7_10105 [Nitrospiria bacterium]
MWNNVKKRLGLSLFLVALHVPGAVAEGPIPDIERYFPDDIGMRWTYQGAIDDKVQKIATYTNVSTVKGTMKKDGVEVKVITESNQANQGPAERYFSRNEDSIVYHGGEPSTPFEDRLVPYLVMQFPLSVGESFVQVEKKAVPYGQDLDGDGIEELAEVSASVTAAGFETVSVPAGLFKNALKLTGLMKIKLTLSKTNEQFELIDKTANWFARDIGMVKGIETIEFPEVDNIPATATVIKEDLSVLPQSPDVRH